MFDKETKKLREEVRLLRGEVAKKTSDYERDAKQSSKKSSEYKNRSFETKELIDKALRESNEKLSYIIKKHEELSSLFLEVSEIGRSAKEASNDIDSSREKIEIIERLYEGHEELENKINKLTDIFDNSEEFSNKINAVYSGLLKRKNEFDKLYFEVMGYDDTDEESGESTRVDGLKDELEKTYSELKEGSEGLKEELIDISTQASNDCKEFIELEEENFENTINSWKAEHQELSNKIKRLLPDALTAGLSSAFSEKRLAEIKEGKKLNKSFSRAILGLVVVSLIPFGVNAYLINEGKALETVLLDMPRMVLSVLPLYIPFLWLAYSTNKKVNLSKRLVEEYTHKEVLSKTFEGLSSQINDIDNKEVSSELRIRLLSNILDVSSENPGKLITDYNKSDHPLMDAIDKSAKLSDAVNALSNIPGLSKITKILEVKSERIRAEQAIKVEDALASLQPDSEDNEAKK